MLGVKTLVTPKLRTQLNSDAYHKAVTIMWDALERGGVENAVDNEKMLCVVLLAGKEDELDELLKSVL